MKHLLSGIAMAALLAAAPAFAQTGSTGQTMQPGVQSGASTSDQMGKTRPSAGQKAARRTSRSPEDNMAEELNRQELQRVTQNNGAPGSGPSGPGGTTTMPGGTSGSSNAPYGSSTMQQPGTNLTPGGTGAGGGRPGVNTDTSGTSNPAGGK